MVVAGGWPLIQTLKELTTHNAKRMILLYLPSTSNSDTNVVYVSYVQVYAKAKSEFEMLTMYLGKRTFVANEFGNLPKQ